MMVRRFLLLTSLAGLCWFQFIQDSSAASLVQRSGDLFDRRPARTILIVGNSRTYFNDMPAMLREIADSADDPTKFEIETVAEPGASFETLFGEARTRRLLAAGWDDVVLQGESRGQANDSLVRSFSDYGARLAAIARLRGHRPMLVINWAYDPALYENDQLGVGRDEHLARIKAVHRRLASDAGLDAANVAGVWEKARLARPKLALTLDGNHPTLAGSYLFALALYARLTDRPIKDVGYVPDGLDPADAAYLRDAVADYPLS